MIELDRDFEAVPGEVVRLSPRVRRVLCDNPGPFTFKGTSTFIIGNGDVAIVDPGPDSDRHFSILKDALRNETVTHILITQTHADHSPLAAKIKAATGSKHSGYRHHS